MPMIGSVEVARAPMATTQAAPPASHGALLRQCTTVNVDSAAGSDLSIVKTIYCWPLTLTWRTENRCTNSSSQIQML